MRRTVLALMVLLAILVTTSATALASKGEVGGIGVTSYQLKGR